MEPPYLSVQKFQGQIYLTQKRWNRNTDLLVSKARKSQSQEGERMLWRLPYEQRGEGGCKIQSRIWLLRTNGFEKEKKIEKEKKTAGQTKNGYRGKVMGCFMLPKQIAWIPEQ